MIFFSPSNEGTYYSLLTMSTPSVTASSVAELQTFFNGLDPSLQLVEFAVVTGYQSWWDSSVLSPDEYEELLHDAEGDMEAAQEDAGSYDDIEAEITPLREHLAKIRLMPQITRVTIALPKAGIKILGSMDGLDDE